MGIKSSTIIPTHCPSKGEESQPQKKLVNGVVSNAVFESDETNKIEYESSSKSHELLIKGTEHFEKLRCVSTFVLQHGVNVIKPSCEIFEVYETLNEGMLYRAEQKFRPWGLCCLALTIDPLIIYDCQDDDNKILKLRFCHRLLNGFTVQGTEIISSTGLMGFFLDRNHRLISHEIRDSKDQTVFLVERKVYEFRCVQYQVKSVSSIEVSTCVATIRTPKDGKVFTEIHCSLSLTFKALILAYSLYLLTLND